MRIKHGNDDHGVDTKVAKESLAGKPLKQQTSQRFE